MNKDFYKATLSSVRHSDELTERIMDMTTEKKSQNNHPMFKRLAVAALALVLFIGGGFGVNNFINKEANQITPNNSVSSGNTSAQANNSFIITAFAAEGEKITINDNEKEITMPAMMLEMIKSEDGHLAVGGESSSTFCISGDNIASVRYQCKVGEFNIVDFDLKRHLEQNGEYYDIIVPYTEEYEINGETNLLQIMYNHIQNGDYDKYFTSIPKKDISEYKDAEYVYDENEKIIGVGLLSNEKYEIISPGYNTKTDTLTAVRDYTFVNYFKGTENIATNYWSPDIESLFENENDLSGEKFTKIPHDTVTVDVTFNDGSVQSKSFDFSFNKNGELVIKNIE